MLYRFVSFMSFKRLTLIRASFKILQVGYDRFVCKKYNTIRYVRYPRYNTYILNKNSVIFILFGIEYYSNIRLNTLIFFVTLLFKRHRQYNTQPPGGNNVQ